MSIPSATIIGGLSLAAAIAITEALQAYLRTRQ